MRIALAFFQTTARGLGTANYGFWADTMRAALTERGHTVLEFEGIDWARGMECDVVTESPAWRDRTWTQVQRDLAAWQAAGGVDLLLGYFFPRQIEPAAITAIRQSGVPVVNFFCDNVREYRQVPAEFRPFNLHWVPEWEALPMYRAAGLPHVCAPMPICIPHALRSLATREDAAAATFLGSHDDLRERLFGELSTHGVTLAIRGKGWLRGAGGALRATSNAPVSWKRRLRDQEQFIHLHGPGAWLQKFTARPVSPAPPIPAEWLGPPVSREEYYRSTRESAVTVGVNRYDSPRFPAGSFGTYSRLRDIEAPMLGACYLTEWAPGLDQLYDLEREIATYRDEAGLAAQLRALLDDAPRRRTMRAAAQARALREHTIGPTLKKIAATLGLGAPA
jgi:hypothetical protein